jgi:Protein of unknown function (DUF1579)
MRKQLTTMMAAACLIVTAAFGPAASQDMPKPGAEHKVLESLVGTWSAKIKFWMDPSQPATEMEGIMVRKMFTGGFFLQEDFDGKFMGSDFKGMGLTGFDLVKKKYVGTWVDSMTSTIMTLEGTYDAKSKTFNMTTSDEIDPATGKKQKGRDTLRIMSPDHQVQEMFRTPEGGKETKAMEIHYHRVKK